MFRKFWSLLLSLFLTVSISFAVISVARIVINSFDKWSDTEPAELTEIGSPYKFDYDSLTSIQKHTYNEILKNIYSMPEKIEIPETDRDGLEEVFNALLADNPDLYFLKGIQSIENYGFRTFCRMKYSMTKDEYREAQAKIDEVCRKVMSGLTDPDNQWQTELEIHDYIVENCEYEFVKEEGYKYSTAYSALVTGVTACEGYSKAAKMLFDLVGIESMTVGGESVDSSGETVGHMWNIVKIDGEYYHLDCTWDDPVPSEDSSDVELMNELLLNMKSYDFFNLSDEMIKETHVPDGEYVECTATQGNYYIKTEKYYDLYNGETEEKILRHVSDALPDGEGCVMFVFGNKEAYEKAVLELGTKGTLNRFFERKGKETGKKFVKNNLWHNPEELTVTVVIEYTF